MVPTLYGRQANRLSRSLLFGSSCPGASAPKHLNSVCLLCCLSTVSTALHSYSVLNNQIRVQVVNPQQQSSFNSRALFLLLSCFLSVSLLRHFVWLSQPNFLPSACASLSLKSLWRYIVKPHGQLVLVSSTPHNAYTPSLSTCWSYRALQDP